MTSVWLDIRSFLRSTKRKPGPVLLTMLTLLLGICAVSTIFSLINTVLLKPLPVHAPSQLFSIQEVSEKFGNGTPMSYPRYLHYQQHSLQVADIAAYGIREITLKLADERLSVKSAVVSLNYFTVLGLTPVAGQFFNKSESTGHHNIADVVISYRFWQQQLGGRKDVIGQTLFLNNHHFVVAGIAPVDFYGLLAPMPVDLWIALPQIKHLQADFNPDTDDSKWLYTVGRPFHNISNPVIQSSLKAALFGFMQNQPTSLDSNLYVHNIYIDSLSTIPGPGRNAIKLFFAFLFVVALMVLIVCCTNVSGILTANLLARQREISVRHALGAQRIRLFRQIFTEALMVTLPGGVLGVALAIVACSLLLRVPALAWDLNLSLDFELDWRMAGFGIAITLLTAFMSSLLPAIHALRPEAIANLKANRSAGDTGTRLRSILMVGQIAISLCLLIATGLLLRSLDYGLNAAKGFNSTHVAIAELDLSIHGDTTKQNDEVLTLLLAALKQRSDIQAVAAATQIPLTFAESQIPVSLSSGLAAHPNRELQVDSNLVSGNYLSTLQISLLAGRDFNSFDLKDEQAVVMINEALAHQLWPEQQAVSQIIETQGRKLTVVGVYSNTKHKSLTQKELPQLLLPLSQHAQSKIYLHIRTTTMLETLNSVIQEELKNIAPELDAKGAKWMQDELNTALLPQKLASLVLSTLSIVGLLITTFGLYAIFSCIFNQRSQEMAVRIVLGANKNQIAALVTKQLSPVIFSGIFIGLFMSYGLATLMSNLLVGVHSLDLLVWSLSIAWIVLAVAASLLVPLQRVLKADTSQLLRAV